MAAQTQPVVVVVDDEVTVRTTARTILQRAGFAVEVADDGRSALAVLERLGARAAVVVLDWTLPDYSGSAILAEVQRVAPHATVIVSTGYGREDVLLLGETLQRQRFGQHRARELGRQARRDDYAGLREGRAVAWMRAARIADRAGLPSSRHRSGADVVLSGAPTTNQKRRPRFTPYTN